MKTFKQVALLLCVVSFGTHAATITVDETTPGSGVGVVEPAADGLCSIKEAFDNANDDAATHANCTAGSGTDTIELPDDAVFSIDNAALVDDGFLGSVALPVITSAIHIQGNDSTIERTSPDCTIDGDRTSNEFRLLAVRNDGTPDDAALEVNRVTLRNGCADGFNDGEHSGGAVTIRAGGGAVFRDSIIEGNSAFRGGGLQGSNIVLERSLVHNNYGEYQGPGVSADYGFTAVNSTFVGNTGGGGNAAIFFGWQVEARLDHVTISSNGRVYYPGINGAEPELEVHNSLFAGSCPSDGITVISSSGNLEVSSSCATALGGGVVSNANLDLQSLADNGGRTPTQALGVNSDAIDSSACLTVAGSAIDVDQRGVARPQDGDGDLTAICDAGAYEVISPDFVFSDGFEVGQY